MGESAPPSVALSTLEEGYREVEGPPMPGYKYEHWREKDLRGAPRNPGSRRWGFDK